MNSALPTASRGPRPLGVVLGVASALGGVLVTAGWLGFERMRAQLAAQAARELLVRDVTAAVGAAPDLDSAFEAFGQRIARDVAFDRVSYVRPDDEGVHRIEAVWGPGSWRLPVGTEIPFTSGLANRVMANAVVVENDIDASADTDDPLSLLQGRGVRSLVVIPLVVGRQVRGMLNFASTQPAAFSPERVALLQASASDTTATFELLVVLNHERRSVETLPQLDRLKNDFVGMVAHDLRSPMSVITGYADTLKLRWDVLTQAQRDDFLTTISRNAKSLATMVEDMLQAARIDSGEYTSIPAPFLLGPLVERTVAEVAQGFGGRDSVVSIPHHLPTALADEQRVWQILSNLVSNACKFSGADQPVEVTVCAGEGLLRVAVTDRGPGIAAVDQERVFEKFTRLGTESGGTKVKGSGLGLYICRSLVHAQGGRIGVDSESGRGSTFWFTIPQDGPTNLDSAEPPSRVTASGPGK